MSAKSLRFIGSIVCGMVFCVSAQTTVFAQKPHDPYQRLDTFAQVLNIIERNYVDDIDRTAMIDGAIQGMLRALDPHSAFMSSAQRKDFEQRTAGNFVGFGVEIGIKDDQLRIITAFHGGPAQKAGLSSGDVILSIDGKSVASMSLDELFNALRGEPGSTVRLTVRHPERLSIENYVVTRALLELGLVNSRLLYGDIGYVRLKSFGAGAAQKVRESIDELMRISTLRGLILDLRQNPGGFLNEGVALANLFLKSGNIVTTKGRNGVLIKSYDASSHDYAYDLPLAVLIDDGSASASEIVAGALQDHRRAVIVGETSFGKASIQNMYKVPDGSTVKLTIGRYYTPSGRCIQAQGIVPDIEVDDLVLQPPKRAKNAREKDLPHALENTDSSQQKTSPQHATDDTPTPGESFSSVDDLQLFTAVQILRAHALDAKTQ